VALVAGAAVIPVNESTPTLPHELREESSDAACAAAPPKTHESDKHLIVLRCLGDARTLTAKEVLQSRTDT
jgi:hypothetical protein